MYKISKAEKVASFKPEKQAYTPPQKLGEVSVIEHYLVRNTHFSKEKSDKRRMKLQNARNLKKFFLALLPYIEEKYDEEISK